MLEGQLRCLMDRVDELNQEAIKFNRFQQQVIRQQQDKHRFLQKRVSLCVLVHVFFSLLTSTVFFPDNHFTLYTLEIYVSVATNTFRQLVHHLTKYALQWCENILHWWSNWSLICFWTLFCGSPVMIHSKNQACPVCSVLQVMNKCF